jgi:hypothetical protein
LAWIGQPHTYEALGLELVDAEGPPTQSRFRPAAIRMTIASLAEVGRRLVNGQRLRRSSRPLPSSLPRLNVSGAAFARNCSRQTASAHKGASENELDLGIAATEVVLSPPGDRVVDGRMEPDQDASTLR